MKIVSVTHYFPSRKGGIESVANEINQRLVNCGHEVQWFASAPAPKENTSTGMYLRPIPAIDIIERVAGIPLPIWFSPRLFDLRTSILEADVVHIHDFIYPGSIIALLFGQSARKPVILTQHIGEIPYTNKILRFSLTMLNHTVGRILLGYANQVVFISNAVESYFRQFTKFRTIPSYIPNGVDREVFFPVSIDLRMKIRKDLAIDSTRKPVFLFVGRFVEKKGLALLSKIVEHTPDIEWLFAGEGPMNPEKWGLPNVRVYGGRRGESLAQLYWAADLLVLPSRGEGFPLVVQEAISCGTPVCISDEAAEGCVDILPLIHKLPISGDGLVELWSNHLRTLGSNVTRLRDQQGVLADYARYHWNWDEAVKSYLDLYKRAVSMDGADLLSNN